MFNGSRVAVIIEDDHNMTEIIRGVLRQAGFEIHSAMTGDSGVEAVRNHSPAIVTLALSLPDIDGFEVLRRIRRFSDSYIMMMSAGAGELDIIMGLESGADDYLTKPFRPRELRARVSAMMRRPRTGSLSVIDGGAQPYRADYAVAAGAGYESSAVRASVDAGGPEPLRAGLATLEADVLEHNGLALEPSTRTVRVDGQDLELTRTEFDLLHALLRSGPAVRTKADLVHWLRCEDFDTGSYISHADERAVEVHIGNLRRKIGDDPRAPRWLKTIRGVGYSLAPARIYSVPSLGSHASGTPSRSVSRLSSALIRR